MVINLSEHNSLLSHWMSKIRDKESQKNARLFRTYSKQIGQILAYEISKKLDFVSKEISTPLEKTNVQILRRQPVIISVLRAGLIMHEGMLSFFDEAESGFVAAYRKSVSADRIEVAFEYGAYPSLDDKDVILCDPMLATGSCLKAVIERLIDRFKISGIHVATIIAAKEGIERIESIGDHISIWCASIDRGLNEKKYILPGLGDAGDLAFGERIPY